TDYIDLFLIHWPNPVKFRDRWQEANAETWRALEDLYNAGRIRSIGISNFRQHHIEALLNTARIAPMVNQIRLCPGDTQDELVEYCRARGMLLVAYSPLGVGKVFEVPKIHALTHNNRDTVTQHRSRRSQLRGYLPLPVSVTPSRIRQNAEVFDFELSTEDDQLNAAMK